MTTDDTTQQQQQWDYKINSAGVVVVVAATTQPKPTLSLVKLTIYTIFEWIVLVSSKRRKWEKIEEATEQLSFHTRPIRRHPHPHPSTPHTEMKFFLTLSCQFSITVSNCVIWEWNFLMAHLLPSSVSFRIRQSTVTYFMSVIRSTQLFTEPFAIYLFMLCFNYLFFIKSFQHNARIRYTSHHQCTQPPFWHWRHRKKNGPK